MSNEEALAAIALAALPGLCAWISAAVSDTKMGWLAPVVNAIGGNVGKAKNR